MMSRYLVTSFSIVPRGTEGAISLEGTVAGLIASVILAAVAQYVNLVSSFSNPAIFLNTIFQNRLPFLNLLLLIKMWLLLQTDQTGAVICVVAAQVANFCESYIGAALQGREGYEWVPVLFSLFSILRGLNVCTRWVMKKIPWIVRRSQTTLLTLLILQLERLWQLPFEASLGDEWWFVIWFFFVHNFQL